MAWELPRLVATIHWLTDGSTWLLMTCPRAGRYPLGSARQGYPFAYVLRQ